MTIRCYGDSNTYGYDPRSYFGGRYEPENRWVDILAEKCECSIVNDGMNGREIPIGDGELTISEDLLIIMLGTNDLLQGRSAKETAEKMRCFLKKLDAVKQKTILITPPSLRPGEWVQDQKLIQESNLLGKYYQNLAQQHGIRFADADEWRISITFDGVHFTEEGHKAFADGLYAFLQMCMHEDEKGKLG